MIGLIVPTNEKYCAERLRLSEGEQFFAIGDSQLNKFLACAESPSLPDLLSFRKVDEKMCFRLREVKFKLEDRLVTKAVRQLRSGLEWIHRKFDSPSVDRVELVIALKQRSLKKNERRFLGTELGPDRYELHVGGEIQTVTVDGVIYPVSLLLI